MKDEVSRRDGCLVVRASGPNLSMRFCRSVLAAISAAGGAQMPVILDFSEVESVDGQRAGPIAAILRMCASGRQVVFAGANEVVIRSLRQTAADGGLFPMCSSVEAALLRVRPPDLERPEGGGP